MTRSLEYSQRVCIIFYGSVFARKPKALRSLWVRPWFGVWFGAEKRGTSHTKNTHTHTQQLLPLTWAGFVGVLYQCKPVGQLLVWTYVWPSADWIELNWIASSLLKMQIWSYSTLHIAVQVFHVLLLSLAQEGPPSILLGEFGIGQSSTQLSSLFLQTWSKTQTLRNSLTPQIGYPPWN